MKNSKITEITAGNILEKPRLDNLAGEIWKSAERLRGKFKQYEYQKVVLPMIVIRRLECAVSPSVPTSELLREFRALEAEADKLLEGLE